MAHSTWLPGSTTLSKNKIVGLPDKTCKAQFKYFGSTQICGSKISSSSNVMLLNYGYGGGMFNFPKDPGEGFFELQKASLAVDLNSFGILEIWTLTSAPCPFF